MNEKEKREKRLFADITSRIAKESHCLLIKVACIAVRNGRIIATGINGTLPGSENCDDYFLRLFLCKNQGRYSKDEFEQWIISGDFKKKHHSWGSIYERHAEVNLVGEAMRNEINLVGCDIYVSYEPCKHCAKLLSTISPKNIFYLNEYSRTPDESRKILKTFAHIEKL